MPGTGRDLGGRAASAFWLARCLESTEHIQESITLDSRTVNRQIMESEGVRFKAARLSLGLTLQAVAQKIGYSFGTISGVENGHDVPSKRLRSLLVEFLNVNESWLQTGKGEMFAVAKRVAARQAKSRIHHVITNDETDFVLDLQFRDFKKSLRKMPPSERAKAVSRFLKATESPDAKDAF
jgi:transcriptional regulator with XRE-family HTH domain